MQYPNRIEAKESHVWATMCFGRKPEFKVHPSEGVANSAVADKMFSGSVAKYYLYNGEWIKVFEYRPRYCSCGKDYARYLPYGHPFKGRKIDTPLDDLLCYDCYYNSKSSAQYTHYHPEED